MKVISGGQTGADQGALRGARAVGWETGGTAPRGWRTDEGRAFWLAEFGLREDASWQYGPRTKRNVEDSHGTLVIGNPNSPGCTRTRKLARQQNKPLQVLVWPSTLGDWGVYADEIAAWIDRMGITILNVAGNRERSNPGIAEVTAGFIQLLARRIK